jgi:hypothetical protein
MKDMDLKIVKLEKPADTNIILGQAHFIKTVEDLYEALINSVPSAKFGIAFCESSGPCLVRAEGNDTHLKNTAVKNALNLAAGHAFIIILKNAYPINVLRAVQNVPEVCKIYCATANDVEVIIAETNLGRGILGVIDGFKSKGVEGESDIKERKALLRNIGYKL